MRFIIIGGDAAGMSAASQARRLDKNAEIIVLEQTKDVSYGACGLPYKLPDGFDVEDLQIITAENFRKEREIDVRLEHRAEKIFPKEHKVTGTSSNGPFELSYDRLLIATGARVNRPPINGLADLWEKGIYPLKTLQDGRNLKKALSKKPQSAVIIGGGYIGLEAAEGLRQNGLLVTIVEALPQILPFLSDTLKEQVYIEAKSQNVEIKVGVHLEKIEQLDSGKIALHTNVGKFETDLVLAATGIRPNSELAAEAGLKLGAAKSIAVDEYLFTSDPDILSAGDCADAIYGITGKSAWVPLALRANRAGKLAGNNALGRQQKISPIMATAVFKFFNLQIARTGLSPKEAIDAGFEPVSHEIKSMTKAHYIPGSEKLFVSLLADRKSHKILGSTMLGSESAAHRIDTVVAALHAGLTVEQLYEMDLAYAPPFGPSWSPLLTCASLLMKKFK